MKRKAFPFLAEPPETRSYVGIEEYPGFHTTGDYSVATMYALGKVDPKEAPGNTYFVIDYPVVVALNMQNFQPKVDYDAIEIVKETLEVHLKELIGVLEEDFSDENIENKTRELVEYGMTQNDFQPTTSREFLSNDIFNFMEEPLFMIMNEPYYSDIVREFAETENISDQVLMDATNQFRYTEDVDESNITAVYYVQPVSDLVEDDDESADFKWEGFDIIDQDSAYSGYWSPKQTLVYGEEQEGVQYHGTTYLRLKQSAPNLKLPLPPSPPYMGE